MDKITSIQIHWTKLLRASIFILILIWKAIWAYKFYNAANGLYFFAQHPRQSHKQQLVSPLFYRQPLSLFHTPCFAFWILTQTIFWSTQFFTFWDKSLPRFTSHFLTSSSIKVREKWCVCRGRGRYREFDVGRAATRAAESKTTRARPLSRGGDWQLVWFGN